MNLTLIASVLSAALAFGGAWQIQSWRFDAKEKGRVEQQLSAEREAARNARKSVENVVDAQNRAKGREMQLRVDAAAARDATERLRVSTAAALSAARESADACNVRVDALGELFLAVEKAGGDMAEKAGRHASDTKTLMDAWPK